MQRNYGIKVAEYVILSRLHDEILELTPIPEEEFDFNTGLSADFQTFRLSEAIWDWFANKETTGAVFLDIINAFASARASFFLVASYLGRCSFGFRVGSTRSLIRTSCAGVLQGSLLGSDFVTVVELSWKVRSG